MKCGYPDCRHQVEGEFQEILEKGYGFCPRGHRTEIPGQTKDDLRCECGARKFNLAGHAYWCPEFRKGKL